MPAITSKIEIEWVPQSGTYVDISSRMTGHVITRPRTPPGQGGTASSVEVEFLNHPVTADEVGTAGFTAAHVGFCPLTPESPVAAYWPNVDRDRRIRITDSWNGGANTSVRALMWTDTWTPVAGDRPPATATVVMTASDILGRYARRSVLSVYGEYSTVALPDTDYFPWDDGVDATTLRVTGDGITGPPGTMFQPTAGVVPGSATLSPPDGGHLTDGQIDFTRGDAISACAPVVGIPTRTGQDLTKIEGWFRLALDPVGSTGDDIISGWDANGDLLWTWTARLISGKVRWALVDNTGTDRSFMDTGAPRDEGWHYWGIQFNSATTTGISTVDKGQSDLRNFGSFAWPYDPRGARYISVGGRMSPRLPGRQKNTFLGSISSLLFQYGTTYTTHLYGNPGVVTDAAQVVGRTDLQSLSTDALVGGAVTFVIDSTPILYTNQTRTLLDRWNEHCRTAGGGLFVRPDGRRQYSTARVMRPIVVSLTLDAEQDLSAPEGGWAGTKEEKPTRVTVTSPLGSYDRIDTATEATTGLRLEAAAVDTAAGSAGVMASVAGLALSGGATRLTGFGIDLTTTTTDKIAAVMALYQTLRIRITGLPPAYQGVTYTDVHASGWIETYSAEDQSKRFVFDTDPADAPTEGRFDDAEYGRFGLGRATVTGGTCVGTTAAGTLIFTTLDHNLTTDPAQYPMYLSWNGERITVSGVGGGSSPQTATVTARGIAPTVARIHTAGEPLELFHDLRFGV